MVPPDASEQMHRHRAHHVVNLDDFQELDAAGTNRAAHDADEHRPGVRKDVGAGRNGNQAGQSSVQAHQKVNAPEHQPRQRQRGKHSGRRCQVRIDQNVAHGNSVGSRTQGELRPAVESEPAEPQDEHAQGHQHNVGRWGEPGRAVPTELAQPGADDQRAGQSGPAAGAVNYR